MDGGGTFKEEAGVLDWESYPDLTAVSKQDLGSILERLVDEEQAVSYRRRVLQGRIDLIRSELIRRGEGSLSPEDLAQVLIDQDTGRAGN